MLDTPQIFSPRRLASEAFRTCSESARSLVRAFTMIELLVVVAIISILTGMTLFGFGGIANNNALTGAHRQVLSALEEARARALASSNDSAHGVHFSATALTLFEGDTYDVSDPSNRVITLSGRVSVSDITLAGGGTEIVFLKASGATTQAGTITVSLVSDASVSRTVVVETSGRIE